MPRKRITDSNNPNGDRLKKLIKLEKMYKGWKEDFTIDFCYNAFMVAQTEKGNAEATLYNYRCFYRRFKKFLDEKFNHATPQDTPIDMIAEEMATITFTMFLREQGLKQSSINAFLRNLKAFGRWCESEGYLDNFKLSIKNVPTTTKEVYTPQELDKLMVKPPITDFLAFRAYCMISLMLNTGARRKTIANIRICDFEVEESYINFNVTKTYKAARLGLNRQTKKDLYEWLIYYRINKGAKETDYLFCNEYGEQLSCNTITHAIAVYNKSRGVEKTSVHLFRHTFAKMWITSGGDIITLARVLTHSELEMVKRYSNLYGGDIKKEIEEHSAISQLKTKSGKSLRRKKE